MKLQPISDVHTEFHKDRGQKYARKLPVNGDVLVIAGDYTTYKYIYTQVKPLCEKFKYVVYTPGNHEFWHTTKEKVFAKLDKLKAEFPNFHWLYNSFVDIEGVRFLGGTMWFDDHPMNALHEKRWSDFNYIKGLGTWCYEDNAEFKKMIEVFCREGDVVVSHHLPSEQSIHQKYRGQATNRWYVSNMERYILARQPSVWFHGHTHEQFTYQIGKTWVIANPRGYDGYEDLRKHRHGFTIEVSPINRSV